MMLQHGAPAQSSPSQAQSPPTHDLNQGHGRKRKADTQDHVQHERLSKRLSLLNLEQNGSKLYVPVENPSSTQLQQHSSPTLNRSNTNQDIEEEPMHLDNTAHKVYIYNIDDELSSESEADDGRLVFLPDIEKHLRRNRIPPGILPNSEGQLAGMQMVLYSDPKSLSVPEESDGVRKAVLEARRRLRQNQSGAESTRNTSSTTPNDGNANMRSNIQREEDEDADDEAMDMD